jgi:hypothetical protein
MKSHARFIVHAALGLALALPTFAVPAVARSEEPILEGDQSICVELNAKTDYAVRRYSDNFEAMGHAERMVVGEATYSCIELDYLRDYYPDQLREIREKIQRGKLTFAIKDRKGNRRLEVVRNTIVAFTVASQQNEPDKRLHVMAGYIASEVTNQAVRTALKNSDLSPEAIDWIATLTGFGAGVVVGALKEAYDSQHRNRHTPDMQDFEKTSVGAAVPLIFKCWKF